MPNFLVEAQQQMALEAKRRKMATAITRFSSVLNYWERPAGDVPPLVTEFETPPKQNTLHQRLLMSWLLIAGEQGETRQAAEVEFRGLYDTLKTEFHNSGASVEGFCRSKVVAWLGSAIASHVPGAAVVGPMQRGPVMPPPDVSNRGEINLQIPRVPAPSVQNLDLQLIEKHIEECPNRAGARGSQTIKVQQVAQNLLEHAETFGDIEASVRQFMNTPDGKTLVATFDKKNSRLPLHSAYSTAQLSLVKLQRAEDTLSVWESHGKGRTPEKQE